MKNKKKKILFLGRFPPPIHGASKVNENYFKSILLNKNYNLKRINLSYSNAPSEIGKINFKKFKGFSSSFGKLIKNLLYFNPDLVYFEIAPKGIAFYRDSLYVLLSKIFRKKIIFQIHARNLKKNFYSKLIFKKTKMILLSKALINEVEGLYDKRDIYILPNGIPIKINEKKFKEILKKRNKNKEFNLLFISNMVEEKGALEVLKICDRLNKKGLKFKCFFVGPWQEKGFEEKWHSFFKKFKLEKKCLYLGPKYGLEKEKIFQKTNFLVFPTKYKNESFPLVILESFQYGVPVFSYNLGAIKEMIKKKSLGFVSDNNNWKDLEKEISKRMNKKVNSNEIRDYFKKNCTLNIAEKRLNKIFKNELK